MDIDFEHATRAIYTESGEIRLFITEQPDGSILSVLKFFIDGEKLCEFESLCELDESLSYTERWNIAVKKLEDARFIMGW